MSMCFLSEENKYRILLSVLRFFRVFSLKNGWICVDNLYERHASCIDTYVIFDYLKRNKKKADYIIWKENLSLSRLRTDGLIVLETPGNPEASCWYFLKKTFWKLVSCKYFISSFYGSLPSKYRQFLLSDKRLKLVGTGHGPVFFKELVFDYPFCKDSEWDYYTVSSDYEKNIFLNHGWHEQKLISCSLPRFDCCQKKQSRTGQRKIFMMLTWRLSFEQNKDYIYSSLYLRNLFHFLNNELLVKMLKDSDVEFVLGLHHALIDICGVSIEFPVKIADPNNLIEEINSSDLFITDYSSIFWDSAYLDHPCIFWRIDDNDRFLEEVDRNDLQNVCRRDADIYNVVHSEGELIRKIESYIRNGFVLESENKAKMNAFFFTRKDNTETFIRLLQEKK